MAGVIIGVISFKICNSLRSCFKVADFKDSQGGIPLDDPRINASRYRNTFGKYIFYDQSQKNNGG